MLHFEVFPFIFQVISENNRDELSIILAGYEDDMNNKLFSFNEGLTKHFFLFR